MSKKPGAAKRLGKSPQFGGIALKAGVTASEMEAALDNQHHLQFVIKWTKSRGLVLMSLQVAAGAGPFIELLVHPVAANTGELVQDMGVFAAGKLTISFIINALMDVKQAATFVVEDMTNVTDFKPETGQPLKALKQGESWSDEGPYTVGQ